MERYLVQVNRDSGFSNIMYNQRYENHRWMHKRRDREHGDVRPGDQLLVYCTGNVPGYRSSLAFSVYVIDVDPRQGIFELSHPEWFAEPVKKGMIYELVSQGRLPQVFLNCGQQGFNIARIDGQYSHILDTLPYGDYSLYETPVTPHYKPFQQTRPRLHESMDYTVDNILADGCFLERSRLVAVLDTLKFKKNIILQGPPGTGKTWLAKRLAFALIGTRSDSQVHPLQFHPNLSYEDFVRGWRPSADDTLCLMDGPFLRIIDDCTNDPSNSYVIVIEEINRGIPAQIFGEMLTLIESDKRRPEEALALSYPRNANERVSVPPNLHIIGTMNVADRSLALVDFALRRRFSFIDLEPTLGEAWRRWVSEQFQINEEFLGNVAERLNSLNETIATDHTLGPQFRIGHSVVTPSHDVTIGNPFEWFKRAVETEIAPLLGEYWFDDPGKARSEAEKLVHGLTP